MSAESQGAAPVGGGLAEVLAVMAKATPGEWSVDTIDNEGDYGDSGPDCRSGFKSYVIQDIAGRALLDSLNSDAAIVHEESDEDCGHAWDDVAHHNTEAIVAAVNYLRSHGEAIAELIDKAQFIAEGLDEEYVAWPTRAEMLRAALAKVASNGGTK